MTDTDLRQDVIFMLILIAVVGLAIGILSSAPVQRMQFIKDCSDTYTVEHCQELWNLGNG